jgi:hypothetical protein
VRAPAKLFLASSNPGKLAEYRGLVTPSASLLPVDLALLPDLEMLPAFEENFATFAENAAGKALHYSRHTGELVFADDSAERPGFIPQGMPGRKRQMRRELKNCWAKCEAQRDVSAQRISFVQLPWRNADAQWRL